MRHVRAILLLMLPLPTLAAASETTVRVEDLGWLTGCWRPLGSNLGSVEQWGDPAGGGMLGFGKTVENGRMVRHEFLMIRTDENGSIEYVASPSGQEPVSFGLVEAEEKRVVFENPEHDYPQRIIYLEREDGVLAARIEGKTQGQFRGIDFPMMRVECVGERDRRASGSSPEPDADDSPRSFSITELGWMEGHWVTDSSGGLTEEIWMAPTGGSMVGSFRWVVPEQMHVLEFLVIEESADGVFLRFKHFDPDYSTWEEDAANTYRLEDVEPGRAVFVNVDWNGRVPQRMIYTRLDSNRLLFRGESPDSDVDPVELWFRLKSR